ncbi:MAG: hypothetical protein H7223_02555 [Pedobacter sp.]|nr:hypothetical protein [Pedobacter sp.]
MKRIILLFLVCFLILTTKKSFGQLHTIDIGFRFQKTVDLYYENGITAQYYLTRRWAIGASYYTSKLGSALSSNAIKQDNLVASGTYFFLPEKALKPFLRGSIGYFAANYEEAVFDNLPNSSAILAADAGLAYTFKIPLKLSLSIGYNAITGSGDSGPGTLYPVFYQTSITWNLSKLSTK